MDEFEDFMITEDILTQLDNIEIDLLEKTLNLSFSDNEENIQPPRLSNRRLRILSTSEESDDEIGAAIQDLQSTSSSQWRDPKDNWYTSVPLARELLQNETHLIGTLRKNRRHFPKVVVSTKLKKGQFIAKESDDGITVLRWRDKRDVLVLSTKHSTRFVSVSKNNKITMKPSIVVDYNRAKGAVDLADQMAAYQSPLRKSLKWYKKLAFDLILNIAMVNAFVLYKSVTNKPITIVDYRKEILKSFLVKPTLANVPSERTTRRKHVLQKKEGPSLKVRRSCVECYKKNVSTFGRAMARNKTKKVSTFCNTCYDKPFLCVECFANDHI
ncbi:unnamed protein product [Leptosia nina]|uniref:PiggyBac transposable element-derived protein domain-containing protein n=1 Tax=Leptosia nina TaxID=320188 RepID=A0AAV1JWC1_9NEOP